MKIFGVGVDVVDIKRIFVSFKKNKKFKERIFSSTEIKYCESKKNKYAYYAKRFAAKEAFVKALGTGFSKGLSFKEIQIKNNKSGKPFINLTGKSLQIIKKIKKNRKIKIFLSLSDEAKYAIAMLVLAYK